MTDLAPEQFELAVAQTVIDTIEECGGSHECLRASSKIARAALDRIDGMLLEQDALADAADA